MSDTAPFSTTPPDPTPSEGLLAQSLAASTPPQPIQTPISAPNKEGAPIPQPAESAPLIELRETEKLPEEVEGWLQKLDQAGDITLPEPITHDGDVLLASTEAQVVKEKLVLPVTQTGLQVGLKSTVTTSARWLAEWCVRLIKVMRGDVKYAPEENRHL
jgi:hypothetical protein